MLPDGRVAQRSVETGAGGIRIGCGSLDGLLARNRELHELLVELRIEHEYEVVPDVAHESPRYYRLLGTKVFEFHGRAAPRIRARRP